MTRELADTIAATAHAHQKRKGTNLDYITHPRAVAEIAEKLFRENTSPSLDGIESIVNKIVIVALLHDVLEDTSISINEVYDPFPDIHICSALRDLTRQQHETYYDFIHRIARSGSVISRTVKLADLIHNMSDLKEGSLKHKYRFAFDVLKQTL